MDLTLPENNGDMSPLNNEQGDKIIDCDINEDQGIYSSCFCHFLILKLSMILVFLLLLC